MINRTIPERKNDLLAGNEVELAIEGRFTNLRIFASIKTEKRPCNDNKIRFRLDKGNQYSVPLNNETIEYLDKEHATVKKLNELFGFDSATLEDADQILEITKDMISRQSIEW